MNSSNEMSSLVHCKNQLFKTGYIDWENRSKRNVIYEFVSEAFTSKEKANELLKICNEILMDSFMLVESRKESKGYRVLILRDKIPACGYNSELDDKLSSDLLNRQEEILLNICSSLNMKDLGQLMQVSQKCNALANHANIWNSIGLSEGIIFSKEEVLSVKKIKNKVIEYFIDDKIRLCMYLKNNYLIFKIPGLHAKSKIVEMKFIPDIKKYELVFTTGFIEDPNTEVQISQKQILQWITQMKESSEYSKLCEKYPGTRFFTQDRPLKNSL